MTQSDFIVVNHEMGHTQYQMSYRNQSYLFRNGANPGFHEGVADILSLAVGEAYLHTVVLYYEYVRVQTTCTQLNESYETNASV